MVTGTVYDPPLEGLPHLVVVFVDGELVHSEPCKSQYEGEMLLKDSLRELKVKEYN